MESGPTITFTPGELVLGKKLFSSCVRFSVDQFSGGLLLVLPFATFFVVGLLEPTYASEEVTFTVRQ